MKVSLMPNISDSSKIHFMLFSWTWEEILESWHLNRLIFVTAVCLFVCFKKAIVEFTLVYLICENVRPP